MNDIKQTPFYADKPFLSMILTPLFIFIGKKVGVEINTVEIVALLSSVISFVLAAKWKGAQMAKAEVARMEAEAKIIESSVAHKALEFAIKNPQSGIKVDKVGVQ